MSAQSHRERARRGVSSRRLVELFGAAGERDQDLRRAAATSTGNGEANNGGEAQPNPALMLELVGGTQNTRVDVRQPVGGGGGGGAVLIACRAAVTVSGLIDAGGGGGSRIDSDSASYNWGPGGGGSGGYVVLQGMAVNLPGEIYANGGGGGGARFSSDNLGSDGTRSAEVSAAGGVGYSANGQSGWTRGGTGGRKGAAPGVGVRAHQAGSISSGGGGGGSTGLIQTYTPEGVFPMLQARGVSPAFEPNRTAQTR